MTDTPAATPMPPAKKKTSIGKWILRVVIALVVIVIIAIGGLYFGRNALVRMGVVRGGKIATGQDTGLIDADLQVSGGNLTLNTLNIANLADPAYKEKNLLVMKKCSTSLDTGTLLSHTVVVKEINIDGLEVWVEQNGAKNNLNDLLAAIQKNMPAASGQSSQQTEPGKELKIDKLLLTNTTVHVRANPFNMDIKLDNIEMDDPTNPNGRPMKIADLVAKVMIKVAQQMLDNPQFPSQLKDGMKQAQALVNNLKGDLDKNVKVLTADLKNLSRNPGEAIKDLQKNGQDVGKNIQDATKGIQGLFGNKPATQPK